MTLTFCKEMKRKSLRLRYGRRMRKDGKEKERYGACIALAFGLRIMGRKVYKIPLSRMKTMKSSLVDITDIEQVNPGAGSTSVAFS